MFKWVKNGFSYMMGYGHTPSFKHTELIPACQQAHQYIQCFLADKNKNITIHQLTLENQLKNKCHHAQVKQTIEILVKRKRLVDSAVYVKAAILTIKDNAQRIAQSSVQDLKDLFPHLANVLIPYHTYELDKDNKLKQLLLRKFGKIDLKPHINKELEKAMGDVSDADIVEYALVYMQSHPESQPLFMHYNKTIGLDQSTMAPPAQFLKSQQSLPVEQNDSKQQKVARVEKIERARQQISQDA